MGKTNFMEQPTEGASCKFRIIVFCLRNQWKLLRTFVFYPKIQSAASVVNGYWNNKNNNPFKLCVAPNARPPRRKLEALIFACIVILVFSLLYILLIEASGNVDAVMLKRSQNLPHQWSFKTRTLVNPSCLTSFMTLK